MAYTEFGKYFKVLRVKNNEVLADAKKFLDCSSAFISSVECGKKPIPDDWFEIICEHYCLIESEAEELRNAINMSQKNIKIDMATVSNLHKQVAIQFQRSFNDLDDETMKEIQKILERNK